MTDDALIHLRVPAATKARWVRESRAAGQRLTDWIIERVERPMLKHTPTIIIPPGLAFSALRLGRESTGDVSMDTAVIEQIEQANGLPVGHFASVSEDAIGALIVHWYQAHRSAGGAPDPVAEDLIEETRLEDVRGGGISHSPGSA